MLSSSSEAVYEINPLAAHETNVVVFVISLLKTIEWN